MTSSRRLTVADAQLCLSQATHNRENDVRVGKFRPRDLVVLRGFRYLIIDFLADDTAPLGATADLLCQEGDGRNLVSGVELDRLEWRG